MQAIVHFEQQELGAGAAVDKVHVARTPDVQLPPVLATDFARRQTQERQAWSLVEVDHYQYSRQRHPY